MDFIAAFSFDILINDSIFIEKHNRIILDLKQLSMTNLMSIFNQRNFKIFFKKEGFLKAMSYS